ncbi:MAG: hypothetical protein Q8934_08985 [Bacillota bacterium]|nr:hypothetical protein [Bacillota bacterium]
MKGKRSIPTNVDGRIKVGPFPLKNFFKWVPFALAFIYIFIKNPGISTILIAITGAGFTAIPFMEFRFKQTGWDFVKEIIRYDLRALLADFFPNTFKHKEVHFERSLVDDSHLQRFTFNKKVYEFNHNQREERKKHKQNNESVSN